MDTVATTAIGIWDDSRHPRDPAEVGLKGGEGMGSAIDVALGVCEAGASSPRFGVTERVIYAQAAGALRLVKAIQAEHKRNDRPGINESVA